MDDPEDIILNSDSSSSDEDSYDSDGIAWSEPNSQSSILLCEDEYFHDHVKALVDSKDVQDKEALNQILIKMASTGNFSVLLVLSNCGLEDTLYVINDKGQTFLHLAFYNDHQEVVDYFIDFLPDTKNDHINYTDSNGLSHLHIACQSTSKQTVGVIEKYLKNGADVNASFQNNLRKYRNGFTPLHFACSDPSEWEPSESVLSLLLKYKANINAVDDLGRTALHILCSMFLVSFDFSKDHPIVKKIKLLLKSGINVNAKDNEGNTALHYIFPDTYNFVNVLSFSSVDSPPLKDIWLKFKLLVNNGADMIVSNNNNDTILHCVIKSLKHTRSQVELTLDDGSYVKMIKYILSTKDVNVNAVNSAGETPLQLAFSMISVDIIKLLLDQNADVSTLKLIKNGFYKSAFLPNLKAVKNTMEMIKLLLDKEITLDLHDNIAVMKFLMHKVEYNIWVGVLDTTKTRRSKKVKSFLENLLEYGYPTHIKSVLNQIIITILAGRQTQLKDKIIQHGQEIMSRKKLADFYVDQEICDLFSVTSDIILSYTEEPKIAQEIALMKNTFVTDDVTLYDIIKKHPFDIYHYIRDVNLEELTRDLIYYKTSVNGHFAKCLARNYIKKIASEYLRLLLTPLLPILCCENISYYLSNEDIFNVCLSVISVNDGA